MAYLGDVRYGVWNDRGHERDEVKIAITLAQPPQSAACGQSGIYADGEQRQRHDDQHKHNSVFVLPVHKETILVPNNRRDLAPEEARGCKQRQHETDQKPLDRAARWLGSRPRSVGIRRGRGRRLGRNNRWVFDHSSQLRLRRMKSVRGEPAIGSSETRVNRS